MRVTVLGTGTSQGVPVIACNCEVCQSADSRDKRLRCSILVEQGDTSLLVDAGPDFRQQMLLYRVANLDGVLLTHEHADHIFGLDDIRSFNWIRKAPMDIYCEKRVAENLKTIFNYAFAENRYPGTPQMELMQVDGEPFLVKGIEVTPIRLYHHKLPVYGFRFGQFAYITDFNRIEEEELAKLKGVEVLIICALRKSIHISHLNLSEALALAGKIGSKRTYLTHMSHEMGLHAELAKELPHGVGPAFDGLVIEM
ncbi:MAG: MBL fold metallo-hydrolase [Prolixibacteraceae bacterium]|nr:MBL fold metallo-hydrolase [Prolixibacteraceae bacterium]